LAIVTIPISLFLQAWRWIANILEYRWVGVGGNRLVILGETFGWVHPVPFTGEIVLSHRVTIILLIGCIGGGSAGNEYAPEFGAGTRRNSTTEAYGRADTQPIIYR